ncbi:serine/threonine-protein kinase [Nocardia neocaledoniensis]|uniref:serine/threonine-protein kinase n=1 Tax=Nocardia neocaledoniensis TaxID=236511 RepID=UPI002458CE86|nr:serine/threonine-protein kinase [Nocardia neocaledoniensis]
MQSLGPHDPPALGRYRLLAVIGRGGMGQVLLGRGQDGRLVAVKKIHPHLTGNPEFRARFRREVEASRQVTGAYTAGVVDHDAEAETPWLASEFIAGPSLQEAVGEFGRLTMSGLKLLATGLAMALIEIHRTGLVHRDLKPSNVLLTNEGPRVIDFGIARAMADDITLTATGAVIGSPAYMSPEQAECRPLTAASDVFAVGALLAMAATGASPFEAASTPQVLYNVLYRTPDTSAIPGALRALVDACLAKDPADRPTPERILELADGLAAEPVWPVRVRRRIADHGAEAAWWAAGVAAQPESAPRRRTWWRPGPVPVAAAVSVLVLAACAWWGVGVEGKAEAMSDPPLALTVDEARRLDICALLKPAVLTDLGTPMAELTRQGVNGCSTLYANPDGEKIYFSLNVAVSAGETESTLDPIGSAISWMPVFGHHKEARICDRAVITQSGLPFSITLQVQAPSGDACPMSERALAAVVHRLSVNPPLREDDPDSVLLLDPCALIDTKAALPLIGDPARETTQSPHGCAVAGRAAWFSLSFEDRTRPDSETGTSGADPTPTVAGHTAYIDSRSARSCDLQIMIRPSRDDQAETLKSTIVLAEPVTADPCDVSATLLAPVLAKLPTS